jgi:predicted dehydrogenase
VLAVANKIRIGIAGLHNWYHAFPLAKAATTMPNVEVVCVAHEDPRQLNDFVQTFNIKEHYGDYEKMLERKDIDAIILTAYTSQHLDLVTKAAEEGKHILCDKPLEVSYERAERLLEVVRKSGIKFMMSYPRRYQFTPGKIKEFLKEGALGKLLSIEYLEEAQFPRDWPDSTEPGWYVDPKKAGFGGFFDHAVHQFDALWFILGTEVRSVFGVIRNLVHRNLDVDDYGVALVDFKNDVTAIMKATWTGAQYRPLLLLNGTEGDILATSKTLELRGRTRNSKGEKTWTIPPPELMLTSGKMAISVDPYLGILNGFVNSIVNDSAPPITIHDGLRSLWASIAAYRSAESKKNVTELPKKG